ncbi:dephospho-CoA kinase [Demequina mangrovi]|uniref:dephospho-CoA kinase n=1 Tax=Demequina mangrovi TaxID=1043493 RepID=UPI0005A767C9|nr:dephospho-CoA kinase [Demequina mangrovi]
MLRIGLTGGIASGKSTAAARFGALGARVVDHDVLARRAVEPGSAALVDIVSEFGDRVIRDHALDRQALASVVFSDDHARQRLNAIVHPYVIAMGAAADRQARREGVDVVVHDIPLLVESGQGHDFDLVVTVAAPDDVRIRRMVELRGMTEADAVARIRAQASDPEREAAADAVLDGSGRVADLDSQVDAFWALHVPR